MRLGIMLVVLGLPLSLIRMASAQAEPSATGKVCYLDVEKASKAAEQIAIIKTETQRLACVEGDTLEVYGLTADTFFVAPRFCYLGHNVIQSKYGLVCTYAGTARENRP